MKKIFLSFFVSILIFFFAFFFLYGQVKPATEISNPNRYFSPNFDGKKDTIAIPLDISDNKIIEKWQVYILEKKEGKSFKVVQKIESKNSKESQKNIKKFFQRIIEKKRNVTKPAIIEWDGKDKKGRLVKDGTYYFKIVAYDETGNKGETAFTPFVLDNTSPVIAKLRIADIFSPNGDGLKEVLDFSLKTFQVKKLDTLEVKIYNQQNEIVKNISFLGESFFTKEQFQFTWDGKDDNAKDCPEGNYELTVQIKDLAGNTSSLKKEQVTLIRVFEEANVIASSEKFSPNEDNILDLVILRPHLSSEKYLEDWQLNIYNENKQIVKSFKGKQKLSKHLLFYGKQNQQQSKRTKLQQQSQQSLPDGTYTFFLKAYFSSGNQIQSESQKIIIDNTPPVIKVTLNQDSFNPNSDLVTSQKLNIFQEVLIEKGNSYRGSILDERTNVVYQYFFTETIPNQLFWDGRDSDGQIIPGKYIYYLQAKDEVGNRSIVMSKPFVLVSEELAIDIIADALVFSPKNSLTQSKINSKKTNLKHNLIFSLKIPNEYRNLFLKGIITIFDHEGKNVVQKIPLREYRETIEWLGMTTDGKVFSDGKYFYQLETFFSTKESKKSAKKVFYIDTVAPKIDVAIANTIFSPNNDGNQDELIISNLLFRSEVLADRDHFKAKIQSLQGTVYKQFEWMGDSLPAKVIWQGDDQIQQIAPEEQYLYKIKATDFAGNTTVASSLIFTLSRTLPKMEIFVDQQILARGKGTTNEFSQFTLSTRLSTTNYLKKIVYFFYEKSGNQYFPLETLKNYQTNLVVSATDMKSLPLNKDNFFIFAKAFFASGDIVEAFSEKIYFDEKPPQITFITTPNYFSPDNDGENEILHGYITITDNDRLSQLKGLVYRKIEYQKGKRFKQSLYNYYENSRPFKIFDFVAKNKTEFQWNGFNNEGDLVESANDYLFFVIARDRVGNISVATNDILVDVFVEKLADGRLKLVVNSIYFKYNSAKMLGGYHSVLQRIIKILNKFPNYKINIIGHTDSRGTERYNQELSTKRAKTVYDYLINYGISQDQLTFLGLGEQELVVKDEENLTQLLLDSQKKLTEKQKKYLVEENFRKNRRVEFFLKKVKKNEN